LLQQAHEQIFRFLFLLSSEVAVQICDADTGIFSKFYVEVLDNNRGDYSLSTSTYRSTSSYDEPRNDIRSMQHKPTRKDMPTSIQSKPTMSDIPKIPLPEDVKRVNNNPVQPPADSYDKAHNFVTRFNSWRSGKLTLPNPDIYEKNFETPMSMKEWIRLRDELKLSESDDQSVFLLQNSWFVFY
jgi:hypothetical protein